MIRRSRTLLFVGLLATTFLAGGLTLMVLSVRPSSQPLTVYSSLPLQGPLRSTSAAMVDGIQLALEQARGRAGRFYVRYKSRDDSTPEARGWAEGAVARNAVDAAHDPSTAVYIGEFSSGASATSIPILSQAKVAQISPASTAIGLTANTIGAQSREPDRYYANGFRNFVRIVPNDAVQGRAMATLLRDDGCRRVALVHDRGLYGSSLARIIVRYAGRTPVRMVFNEQITRPARDTRRLAVASARLRVDCFVFSGDTTRGAVNLITAVARVLPSARLYGLDGIAGPAFTDVAVGGVSERVAARVQLTLPTLGRTGFGRAGLTFLRDFTERYGRSPDAYAIYGYEAMRLALDAIARSPSASREEIVRTLFSTRNRDGAIGRYSIDDHGDTTLSDYGLWKIEDGRLRFVRRISASP